jgi:4-amino-4-deoxy-L-arabinose transferase-like glycosyltransferase
MPDPRAPGIKVQEIQVSVMAEHHGPRRPGVPTHEFRWTLAVAAGIVLAFFVRMGAWPLFDLDEGAFSQATREMMYSGNYLSTWLDGQPRYDKPILSYWMQALAVHLFGPQEWAFRLPSAIAAGLWVGVVYGFARERLGAAGAGAAALLIAFSLGPMVIGRAATADAWLNLWLTLTFLEIARWQENPRQNVLMRAYLWMGLGFLTKGPVAIAIPLLASLVFFLAEGRGREWFRAIFNGHGWVILAVVALPWYLLILLREGTGFFYGFFVEHNLNRFLHTREGHGGSLFYYALVLPLVLLPFAGWFLATLGRLRYRPQGLELLSWVWFGVTFILFSLSSTQLPHYILYGTTPLLLLLAIHRDQLRNRWLAFLPAILLFALMLAIPDLLRLALDQADRAYERELILRGITLFDQHYRWTAALFLLGALGITLLVRMPIWNRLLLIGALQAVALVTVLIPGLANLQQYPVKRAAEIAREATVEVVAYGFNMPSFSVYRGAVTERRMPLPGEIAVTRAHNILEIQEQYPDLDLEILYHAGGVVLLRLPATGRKS